jgi:hypothetical protein
MKYETLTSDKVNYEHGLCAFHLGVWETVNESVTFKHRVPNGRKVITVPDQFCASLRQVVRSFSRHTAYQ